MKKPSKNVFKIRELLAGDRTELANERTLLSYIRTSLTIIIVGFSLNKFFDIPMLQIIGVCLILLGVGTIIFGLWRYINMKQVISSVNNRD